MNGARTSTCIYQAPRSNFDSWGRRGGGGGGIALRFPSLNLTISLMLMADKTGENNMLCCLA